CFVSASSSPTRRPTLSQSSAICAGYFFSSQAVSSFTFIFFSVQQESAAFPPPLLFCVQKPILPFVRLYAYFQGYSPGYAVLFPDIFSAKDAVFLEDICQITVLLLSRAACPYQFQQYLPEPPSL